MPSPTFAACLDDGRFDSEEAKTGPASAVLCKPNAFWSGPTPLPARQPRAERRAAKVVAEAAASDGRAARKAAVVSPAMCAVFDLLQPLARAEVTVTLIGETGTGKDVLARIIHQNSARASGPFVVFDCGAVAANLAESELLGHERGAFTGALATHAGAFERANGGTLFLDEIGELPLDLQTRLLRVLGNRSVRRVGGTVDRPVDVRIVAATNRELQTEVAAGRFRQDLYFRLAAAVVQVPALRDRREDIPMLVRRLLDDLGHGEIEITPSAVAVLCDRAWPGNVRELKNALACAVAFLDGPTLEARHLTLPQACESKAAVDQLPLGGLRLDVIERVAIAQTLRQTSGNKARAAQLLGIAPSTLYEKLKKLRRDGDDAQAAE
jgi:two-component system, NtrC family, response regulator HydG